MRQRRFTSSNAETAMTTTKTLEKDRTELPAMHTPPIVSPEAWETARQQMLVKEKAHTRARDALAAQRRRMPWMAVEKRYAFEGPQGKVSLLDLFEGRRQLIVYRAFFEPAGRSTLATAARSWPTRSRTWPISTLATPLSLTSRAHRRRTSLA
jgi:hypothetical protein